MDGYPSWVVEVKPGCFDLGCFTICNGTVPSRSPWIVDLGEYVGLPELQWEDLGVLILPVFVILFIVLDMCGCLVGSSRSDGNETDDPGDTITTSTEDSETSESEEDIKMTPQRRRISLQVGIPTPPNFKPITKALKVTTNLKADALKRYIVKRFFPGAGLNENLDYSLCFDSGDEEELDLDKSLSEQGINEDGIKVKIKERQSSSAPSSPISVAVTHQLPTTS